MANLSNINNILRTSSLGVGINCDAEFSLDIEKASANAILSLNSNGGSGAEYLLSSTTSGEFVLNKRYVGDRLTISSGGDATFAGNVTMPQINLNSAGGGIIDNQTGNIFIQTPSGTGWIFRNGPSGYDEKMRIDSSGNVGIGTDSPDAKFQVQGNVKVGSASGASWTDAKDDVGGLDVFVGSGSNAFQVWDDNDQTNPRFVVERAGNVGIGTNSPGAKLTIGDPGGATTRSIQIEGNTSVSGMNGTIGYFSNALYISNNYYYNSAQVHPISTYGQTNIVQQTSTVTGGNFIDFNVSDHTDPNNAPDTRIRILDSGNVGIGTVLPGAALDVQGPIGAGVFAKFGINDAANDDPSIQIIGRNTANTTAKTLQIGLDADADYAYFNYNGGSSAGYIYLKPSGNVGIGTDSPSAKFQVNGEGLQGMQAWFGNGFINNANYHYSFAKVGFSNTDPTGTETGAGFQFNTRNSSNGNWMHGYIYQPQDGGIAFGTGGAGTIQATERMGIESGSNIRVNFNQSGSTGNLYFQDVDNGASMFYIQPAVYRGSAPYNTNYINAANSSNIGFIAGGSERMRIESGGNVGIGTTSPTNGKLEVQQTASTAALWVQTGGTTSSHTIADFRTGTNASALAIKGNSRVTINQKPNSGIGYAVLIDIGTGANGEVGYQTLSQLNTNLAGASDIRFKKNIEIIPNAIEKIKTINGYTFDWDSENEDYNYSEKEGKDAGIIAQEIQKVLPEIVQIATVDRDEEGKSTSGKNYLSVDYKKIIPLLIQGIKEQETSIQELKAEIEILKNK